MKFYVGPIGQELKKTVFKASDSHPFRGESHQSKGAHDFVVPQRGGCIAHW